MTDRHANRALLEKHLLRKHNLVLDHFHSHCVVGYLKRLEQGTISLDEVADELAENVGQLIFQEE